MRKWSGCVAAIVLSAVCFDVGLSPIAARAVDAPASPAPADAAAKDAEEHFGQTFYVPPHNWIKKEVNGWLTLTPPNVAAGQFVSVYMSPGVKSPNTVEADFKAQVSALEQGYKVTQAGEVKKTPIEGGWEQLHQVSQLTDANGVSYLRDYTGFRHDGWFDFVMLTGTESGLTEEVAQQFKTFVETVSYDRVEVAAPVPVPPPVGMRPAAPPPVPPPVGAASLRPATPAAPATRPVAANPPAAANAMTPAGHAVLENLQGVWIITGASRKGGREVAKARGNYIVFYKNLMCWLGETETRMITSIDPAQSPGLIDFNTLDGGDPDQGLYKLDGDKLQLAIGGSYDRKSEGRPAQVVANDPKVDRFLTLDRLPVSPGLQTAGKAFEGSWKVESVTGTDGMLLNDEHAKASAIISGDGLFVIAEGTDAKEFAVIAANPAANPPTFELWRGDTYPGIYKVDGDRLTIAFAKSTSGRPTSFYRTAGVITLVLVRQK